MKNISLVFLGSLISLSFVAYASSDNVKFDKSVQKKAEKLIAPVYKDEIVVSNEKIVPVTPVISTNGFSFVSTASNGRFGSSVEKFYDDDAKVVCYRTSNDSSSNVSLQCLKNN